jgi:hypothetical protein
MHSGIERKVLALAVGAFCSLAASAGGVATLEIRGDGEVQPLVYEFSGDQVRMGLPGAEAEGYMLLTGGVPYMVMTGDELMVFDLRQSMQMIGGMVEVPAPAAGVEQMHQLEATGRAETVAGIPGEVYRLTYSEDGQQKTEELVLSADERARAFGRAMNLLSVQMAGAAGVDGAADAQAAFEQALDGKGLLRMGDQFRLARYEARTPGKDRFQLPAPPTDLSALPGMQGLFGQQGGAAGASGGGGVDFGGLFGSKAQRQQERIEGRTEQEVDQATDSAVDKALDKAFKKLFGD